MPPKKATAQSAKKARKSDKGATGDKDLLAALRRFIRTEGEDYLRDPNISSIGIGYKVTDGKRTPELSVQFTVNEKHSAPDALEALGTTPVPESITINGVEVPTDVLERRYEPAFRVVAEPVTVERKVRIDPIVPGVSVGQRARQRRDDRRDRVRPRRRHAVRAEQLARPARLATATWATTSCNPGRTTTTGSSATGWAGSSARTWASPGTAPSPASRTASSTRPISSSAWSRPSWASRSWATPSSSPGGPPASPAASCAASTPSPRSTTAATVGVQNIGCFEIGPDPDHPAPADEISRGGDSGALWLFTKAGAPQPVMAGLHFGGEADISPDEHALACLPASVFEKLEISLQPPAAGRRRGRWRATTATS